MTCSCGSNRILSLSGKCNDLCSYSVRHLNLAGYGYVPDLGAAQKALPSGDYLELELCLDCGKVQNWVAVSDEELKGLTCYRHDGEATIWNESSTHEG